MRSVDQSSAAPAVVLGVGGYLLGLGFLLIDWNGSLYASFQTMIRKPPDVILWCLLIAAQAGMWLVLTASLVHTLPAYSNVMRSRWRPFTCVIVAITTIFATFLLSRYLPDNLVLLVSGQMWKVGILTLMGFLPFIAALTGMYLVGAAADQRGMIETEFQAELQALIQLSDDLQNLLITSGVIIGAATLATGVLQQAIHSLNPTRYQPNTLYALLYGSFGTGIIALLYLPAYASLKAAIIRFGDNVLPLPLDVNDIANWRDKRSELESLLGLDKTALERLKAGVAILSPIIAGAGSYLAFK
jgi:hypothetical protein